MGAWNSKPFGNDSALDWLACLEIHKDGTKFIEETIGYILSNFDGDSEFAQNALAAVSIIGAASVNPIGSLHKEAKSWVALTGYLPNIDTIKSSIIAIEIIIKDSELRDLWEEQDLHHTWIKNTEKTKVSLINSLTTQLPKREPKKRGMPRRLHKLMELYEIEPSDKIRKKINEKLDALKDVNAEDNKDTNFTSPLTLTSKYGLYNETKKLLERGANPNNLGNLPLKKACMKNHIDIAQLLLDNGAELYEELKIDYLAYDNITKPYMYCEALMLSVKVANVNTVKFLISKGTDINYIDFNKENFIFPAASHENIDVLKFLIDIGLDVNHQKHDKESPLHNVVRIQKIKSLKVLLQNNANLNLISVFQHNGIKYYDTPLDLALYKLEDSNPSKIDIKFVSILKKHGAKTAEELMHK